VFFQIDPIGGDGHIFESGYGHQLGQQKGEILSYKGLTPGQTDFIHTQTNSDAGQAKDFFIGQNVLVPQFFKAFGRHAVEALKVASVRDGDAKIIETSFIVIN